MADREPLAARLLATFLDELEDQLRTLDGELLALETHPADVERLRSVFRVMHTLKGAARAAGVRPIEEMCHALETRLAASRDAGVLRADELPLLFAASDALSDAGKRLRAGDRVDTGLLLALGRQLGGMSPAMASAPRPAAPPTPAAPAPAAPAPLAAAPATTAPAAPEPAAPAPELRAVDVQEQVRLGGRQVEALVGVAGDVLAASGAIAARPAAAAQLYDALIDWRRDWRQASRALRPALDRSGADTRAALDRLDGMIATIARDAARLTRVMTDDARALSGTAARFQDNVRRLRMRPFGDVVEALPRAARDVAAELGKDVRLVVEGQAVEADRAVLDTLRDPLLQLVRNAVDHGIEKPQERERRGKPATGTITVGAEVRGDALVVTVADDGGGIDVAAVRAAMARRGAVAPVSDADVARAVLDGGVSTRAAVTTISGRGVGLDIVRATTDRLGGTADVTSRPRAGTTFTLTVPVSAATVRALLVRVGDVTVAIPATSVERVIRVRRDAFKVVQGQLVLPMRNAAVSATRLARALGLPSSAEDATEEMLRGVLVAHGPRRAVVIVDDVVDERELVVRPLEHVDERTAAQYSGGALLDATRVALVVNPAALVMANRGSTTAGDVGGDATEPARTARILVVDDSITTRTLEQSVLSAAGYDVVTAVDGADGWRIVEAGGIDLVMTDVEMPRMDGIALCERIRATPKFGSLPVVIVTSLDRPEERARGLEAGADAYVTKSSFDQDTLLEIVEQLLEDKS
ncbi:MAG TPA: response regulator [Gemmatimonadaceae bacterium]|nr:response regulator [Gemmatimonadaceae bacterium]